MKDLVYSKFIEAIAGSLAFAFNVHSVPSNHDLISPHFKFSELYSSEEASRIGLQNCPDSFTFRHLTRKLPVSIRSLADYDLYVRKNLAYMVHYVLEPLRVRFGRIRINSGFRCLSVNELLDGSSEYSYHMFGRAADIFPLDASIEALCCVLDSWNVKYIKYNTFIHVQI